MLLKFFSRILRKTMHGTGKANYLLLTGGAGENVVETEFERESRQDTEDNLYKLYRRPDNDEYDVDHYLDQLNDNFDEADLNPLLPATHENAEFIRYYGVHTNFRNGPAVLYSEGEVILVTLREVGDLRQGAGVVTFQVIADGNFEGNVADYNLFQSNFSKRQSRGEQQRQGIRHDDNAPDTYIMNFQGTNVQFANAVNGYVEQSNRVAYTYGGNAQHVYRFREYGGNHGKVTVVDPDNNHRLTVKIEGYGYLLPYDRDRQRTMGSTLKKMTTGGEENEQHHFTYASLRDQMRQPAARDLLTMYKYCAVDPDPDLDITKRVKYGNSLPFRKYRPGPHQKLDGETEQVFMDRIQTPQEGESNADYQRRRIASLEGAYQLLTGNNDEVENGAPICKRLAELVVDAENRPEWNDENMTPEMKLYAKSWKYCDIEDDLADAWDQGVTTCPKYTRILEEAQAHRDVARREDETEAAYTRRMRNSAVRWSDQQPTANMFQKQYGKRKAQEQGEILNPGGNDTRTQMKEMVSVNQRAYQKRLKTVQGRKELGGGERYLSQNNIRRLVAGGIHNLAHRKVDPFDLNAEHPHVTEFAVNNDPIIDQPHILQGNGVWQYLITLQDTGNLMDGDYVSVQPVHGNDAGQEQYGYVSEINHIGGQIKFLTTSVIDAIGVELRLVPNTTVAQPCDIQRVLEYRVELGNPDGPASDKSVAQLSNKYNSSAKYWLSSGNTNGTYGVPALCAGAKIYRKGATRPSKKVKDKGKQKQCNDLITQLQLEGDGAIGGLERLKLIMQYKLRHCHRGDGNELYKKKDFANTPHLRTYNIFEALDRVVMSDAKHTPRDRPTPLELIIAANITPPERAPRVEGRVVPPEAQEDIMVYRRGLYNNLHNNVPALLALLTSHDWINVYNDNVKTTKYKQCIQGLMTPDTISVIQKDIEDYIIECLKRGKQRAQTNKREQVFGSDILLDEDPGRMEHIYKVFRRSGLDIGNLEDDNVLGFDDFDLNGLDFDLNALDNPHPQDVLGLDFDLLGNPAGEDGQQNQQLDQHDFPFDNFNF
jgi:hypothetical protein